MKNETKTNRLCFLLFLIVLAMLLAAAMFMPDANAESITPHYSRARLHEELKARYPEGLPWATVNAWDVCFREGPGKEYRVREKWSVGVAVEVIREENGWMQVLHWTCPEPMWVWHEYLTMAPVP